jgi:hypothetical protein
MRGYFSFMGAIEMVILHARVFRVFLLDNY